MNDVNCKVWPLIHYSTSYNADESCPLLGCGGRSASMIYLCHFNFDGYTSKVLA